MYEKTQSGTTVIIVLGLAVVSEAGRLVYGVAAHRPSMSLSVDAFVFAILLAVGIVFSSMTIRLTGDAVEWNLAFGMLKQRLTFAQIESCEVRRVPWFAGFGWRTNGRDTLWIVNGRQTVAMTLRTGRKIGLGTNDAPKLCAHIESRLPS